jgi:hypothetical protein
MTHLSDSSYVDRLIPNIMIFIFLVYFCFQVHNAAADLTSAAIRKGKLKGIILMMYLSALVLAIIYDFLAIPMKYDEGFIDTCVLVNESIPLNSSLWEDDGGCRLTPVQKSCRGIITKPGSLYSERSLERLDVINLLWNMGCTIRNSAMFMLLAVSNSTVKNMIPKPVMNSWEVKLFAYYSILSLFLYFFLQFIFADSALYSTIAPQLLYTLECAVGGIMLLLTNLRIRVMGKLQKRNMQNTHNHKTMEHTLAFVKTMNNCLALALSMDAFALGCINLDIILVGSDGEYLRVIYTSKLLTDIFTRIFNM